jgi:ATP-binding cassette subfamily G (WHITE) protein 2 (PDR)
MIERPIHPPSRAWQLFDKVSVLYAGEQIFLGPTNAAKQFFVDMVSHCPEQSTTPDFLTSLTSPAERRARPGFEQLVPKTPKEFVARWKSSDNYAKLQMELEKYEAKHPVKGQHFRKFLASRRAQQSKKV